MSKSLREEEINELKLNADIYNIVSNYVNLKKSGKNYIGLCPFHKEKTPSFVVDTATQLFYCFGCGVGGDVISFIMKIENLSFIEAVELIAKKIGYSLKYIEEKFLDKSFAKSRLIELNELAKKYYNYILLEKKVGKRALDYLKSRKISIDTIKKFDIGYSLNSWDAFSKFAKSRNFTEKELVETGLSIPSSKLSLKETDKALKVYDRFRGRIIFPIKDLLGRTIGFGGRVVPGEVSVQTKAQAKYINSPETKLYSKGKSVYGIYEAKNNIIENDNVLVVEGYMDVITLYEKGIRNVVASLGTALTIEQVKLISRFTKNIILIFDSDSAGVSASIKSIEKLKEYNENLDLYNENNVGIKVCLLEHDYDPADYVLEKGQNAFLEKVKSSANIIDFIIDMTLLKYNLKEFSEKLRAVDELLRFISSLSSRLVQEECIKKIALKLNLKESVLLEEMLKKKLNNKRNKIISWSQKEGSEKQRDKQDIFNNSNLSPQLKVEVEALKLIIHGFDYERRILIELDEELFKFDETRNLFKLIKQIFSKAVSENRQLDFPVVISSSFIKDEKVSNLYNFIYFSSPEYSNKEKACLEIASNMKVFFLNEKIEKLKNEIAAIEKEMREIKAASLAAKKNDDYIDELEKKYSKNFELLIELENKKLLL